MGVTRANGVNPGPNAMQAARTDKELIDATRPFAQEHRLTSWWKVISTFTLLAAGLVAGGSSSLWAAVGGALAGPLGAGGAVASVALRITLAVVTGLLVVRAFILYHDYLHGAILRRSSAARALFYTYGIFALTPPRVWRETHNYHHAHTAKIVGSHVGSYAMVTPAIWAKMSAKERLVYKIIRHPVTILLGYFTIFMYGMGVSPLLRSPKKNWDSAVALVLALALNATLPFVLGPAGWIFGYLLPMAVAMATGAYLFYAQHNFPDIHVQPRDQWSYTRAALESSSFMRMGPVMRWFTGNIGYHHVHHLNQAIPFYRLPEAMAAIPELQDPPVTTLTVRDIVANFRLKLWDPEQGRMVGYPS